MTAKEILSLAKAKLVLNHPFFASLVLGMNIEEKDAEFFAFAPSPTMATDGKNIYYFKEFVESLTVNQVVGVLAHEGCHVGFLHHTRRQSRNVTVWNIACVRGDSLISMADGSYKEIVNIKKGEEILGELEGKIIKSKVLTTLSKLDYIMEVCFQGGYKLYCTPTHKLLTERGYIEAEKLQEGEGAYLDRRAEELYSTKLNNNDNSRNGKDFGSRIPSSGCFSLYQRTLFSKKNCEERKFKTSRLFRNRPCLFSRNNRWRRNNNNSKEVFNKTWKKFLQTLYFNLKYFIHTTRIFNEVWFLCNSSEKQLQTALVENRYQWVSNNRLTSEVTSIPYYQERESRINNKVYLSSLRAETQRQANYRNGGYTPKDKRIKYERIVSIRRLEEKESVFDLTTTSHSYIANGVICHNCDASINPILKDSGFELPDDCIMGPPNCYAEAEYARLYKEMKGGKGGKGNGKKYKAWGEVIDPSGKDGGKATREEIQAAEQEAKIKIVQALEQSKNRGNVPAGIARLVQEILEPKVDWKQLLRNLIDQVARNDYNWQTPNRRFIHSGIYVPGIKSRELGTVVVAEDTSGSVGQKALDQFNSELTSIVEEFDTNVWLLPTDVKVHNPQEFTRHDLPLKAKICGGGGTSFRHPFEWVSEQEIGPTVMIYLTDGWCDEFPKFTPDYPVIWVVTENKSLKVPFGDLIFMELNENNGR